MSGPKPIPTSQPNEFVLPTYDIPEGGQTRETFKIDRYGNLYNAHTTIEIPGKKKDHIKWTDD